MSKPLRIVNGDVKRLSVSPGRTATQELNKIRALVRDACPVAREVSFDFDERLLVHIDVRKLEEVTLVQAVLPTVGMGMFQKISLGKTPFRPFSHRISAEVA
jgi:hypothetical protein